MDAGGDVSGFSEARWKIVQKMQPGDRLICYVTGISRFIGILEVTSKGFQDSKAIWSDAGFTSRVQVKPLVTLDYETALPVTLLRDQLSVFENLKSPSAWSGAFRGSPAKWNREDGETIYKALVAAKENPIKRPVDPKKLVYRPRMMRSQIGAVTVPDAEDIATVEVSQREPANSDHDRIQMALAKLGSDMGLDIWVARNDRNKQVDGIRFSDLPRTLTNFPIPFDPVTAKTVQLIDLLWLKGKAIVAAFEIESTTSIYSGLLRFADMLAMQPNLSVPLYVVAPDERRDKVMTEIGRPSFSRLEPPMKDMCKFIPFSAIEERIAEVAQFVSYLKPDFIDELAEPFEGDDEDVSESA